MTLTPETTRRIKVALAETQRFIDKESPRNADTRPADMLQHLNFCIAHKARLLAMLEGK